MVHHHNMRWVRRAKNLPDQLIDKFSNKVKGNVKIKLDLQQKKGLRLCL